MERETDWGRVPPAHFAPDGPALDMQPWGTGNKHEATFHPSSTLRVRGNLRVTTKKEK